MQIVAIGGGEIADRETLPIDRFIVELSGRKSPKALFVPTASGDAPGYCETFEEVYGKELGCDTEHLLLASEPPGQEQIREMIMEADLVYVGGGNTLKMMKFWGELGVGQYLQEAGENGTVLSGLSAGGICWHEWGHSDSESFSEGSDWDYTRVEGLGFCKRIFCPHLDAEDRHEPFSEMIQQYGITGIACENGAAVWYDGPTARVKSAQEGASVHVYEAAHDRIYVTQFYDGEVLNLETSA